MKNTQLLMRSFMAAVAMLSVLCCAAQQSHRLIFLKAIRSDEEVRLMNDSLPLFLYQGKVFQIQAECIDRNAAGGANTRAAAGGNNERAAAGGNNQRAADGGNNRRDAAGGNNQRAAAGGNNARAAAGGNNNRAAAGGNNKRAADGGNNNRAAAGGNNERAAAGGNNKRDAASGAEDFSCGKDANGDLIIYLHNIKPDKDAKIYFNGKVFARSQNFFKMVVLAK